jgi:histidinol-phosphatase
MNATRIQVSSVGQLADASLSYSDLHGWVGAGRGLQFGELMRSVWRTRAFGDFYSYMLVAEGAVDIATEPELKLHDMAALDVVVREAGGVFTSIDGGADRSARSLATNGSCTRTCSPCWPSSTTTPPSPTRPRSRSSSWAAGAPRLGPER